LFPEVEKEAFMNNKKKGGLRIRTESAGADDARRLREYRTKGVFGGRKKSDLGTGRTRVGERGGGWSNANEPVRVKGWCPITDVEGGERVSGSIFMGEGRSRSGVDRQKDQILLKIQTIAFSKVRRRGP